MPHSIVSSTGSDHGTVSPDSTTSFNPERDATMSSDFNLNYTRKIPALRSASKKYGRWQTGTGTLPTPFPDYVINTSAIGRIFPEYSSGSSDNSSSFSLNLSRAPLQKKAHTNTTNTTNTNTHNNRPKSPILDALRPLSPPKENIPPAVEHPQHARVSNYLSATNTPPKEKSYFPPTKENLPSAVEHSQQARVRNYNTPQKENLPSAYSQRTRAEMQPRVDDDSNLSIMSHRNSRFQIASPNVSSKRTQNTTPLKPTQHTALTSKTTQHSTLINPTQDTAPTSETTQHSTPINPTQHSFAVPAATSTSETNSATLNNGVPVTTNGGRVHARRNSKALIHAASFGPVHSIPIPEEEEGIYLLIELLKNRVARVEAENTELKDFKESNIQLKEDHQQLSTHYNEIKESHNQLNADHERLITHYNEVTESHNQLNADHERFITHYNEVKESHTQIQEDHEKLIAQYKEIKEDHEHLLNHYKETKEHFITQYKDLKEDHAQLVSKYEELQKSHSHLDNQNKLLDSEKAQWALERRSLQARTVAEIVQQQANNQHGQSNLQQQVHNPQGQSNLQQQLHNLRGQSYLQPQANNQQSQSSVQQQVHSSQGHGSVQHQANDSQSQTKKPVEKPTKKPATLSSSARHVLDSLCPEHNTKNCMLCTRVTSFGDNTTGGAPIRSANPIPVSKRMPVAAPYEEEPTIRPSVEPSLALSTVIKGLEDEIAHLKMRQSEVQKQYQNLDASLGKRERRRVGRELESLLQQLEFKGDQLYGLYDALEGLN